MSQRITKNTLHIFIYVSTRLKQQITVLQIITAKLMESDDVYIDDVYGRNVAGRFYAVNIAEYLFNDFHSFLQT